MRYTIVNDYPVPVRSLIIDGNVVTNPPDFMIDEAGAGYPLDDSDPELPSIDPDVQKIVLGYAIVDGTIRRTTTVVDKTTAELLQIVNENIRELNTTFEAYKDTPIVINGKGYLPRWVYEYYNSMLLLGVGAFPMSVASVDGSATEMTYDEFRSLYQTLVSMIAAYTGTVNAELASLNATKAALMEE